MDADADDTTTVHQIHTHVSTYLHTIGGYLTASLGGTEKIVSGTKFSNDLFLKKNSILTPKIFDDLILVIHRLIYRIWSFSWPLFQNKKIIHVTFFSTSYLPAHPITLLLQILGGRMHWPSPHLKFWRDRPSVSRKSPPMHTHEHTWIHTNIIYGYIRTCMDTYEQTCRTAAASRRGRKGCRHTPELHNIYYLRLHVRLRTVI